MLHEIGRTDDYSGPCENSYFIGFALPVDVLRQGNRAFNDLEMIPRFFLPSRVTAPFAPAARRLVAALFAGDCLLCGDERGTGLLCRECAEALPSLPEAHCLRCAQPTAQGATCGHCLAHPPHYDRTLALYRYQFPVDKMIQSLKYRGQLPLAGWFGERLGTLCRETFAVSEGADPVPDSAPDLIVPLPLHRQRLSRRGFNQALEIARPVAKMTGIPLVPLLCQRIRATTPQVELPWKERAKNVKNAFMCNASLAGKHVLLIDDVMTSGATLDECARTLKLHGAEKVTIAVAARAAKS